MQLHFLQPLIQLVVAEEAAAAHIDVETQPLVGLVAQQVPVVAFCIPPAVLKTPVVVVVVVVAAAAAAVRCLHHYCGPGLLSSEDCFQVTGARSWC